MNSTIMIKKIQTEIKVKGNNDDNNANNNNE